MKQLLGFFGRLSERLRYRNMPIQKKIISTFLILIIIPLIVYYVIFGVYTDNTKTKEIQLIDQLNKQAVDGIDSYVNDITQLTMQPLYNDGILEILHKIDIQYDTFAYQKTHNFYNLGTAENGVLLGSEDKELSDMVRSMRASKKFISSVFFFQKNSDSFYNSLAYGQLIEPYNPNNEEWFNRSKELNGAPAVSGVIRIPNMLPKQPYGGNYVFTVSRAIKYSNTIDVLGYLSIFSDIDVLREQCAKIISISGEKIFIVDSKNSIVYDINEKNIAKNINDGSAELSVLKNVHLRLNNSTLTMDGEKYLLMVNAIESADWKLVRVIPENILYVNARSVQGKLIFLVILFSILSLLISISISYGITNPLKKLIRSMKLVEKGDLSIRFKTKYNDEIGQLGKGFNNMIGEIESLINDVYITSVRKKEAELNALQAQINPHFIYNTMESIRMMARINKDADTAYMISILGSLLRYSIHTKNQVVEIKEEFEHLKNYMILQNHRFENKFELVIELPEELSDTKIIKLIFQPIVENAIYHALETIEGKGVITITAHHAEDKISFFIEDNGIGMTEEQLENLNQSANDFTVKQGHTRGIGLKNINERIKLYYGENYGIEVFSQLGRGSVVRLELPAKKIMERLIIQ